MALAPGTVLGRYEIKSLLGQGGMGAVYRAADTSLGRDVALKVLDPSVAVDPERVHRFLQEARAASALNHPNIIAIHEAGESGGTRFIATELVEGRTLREMLEDGPLPIAQALDIASQVASALAAAHVAGIVHRDIKPENIMVRPDGYAKVLDFGLAKLTDSSASGANPSMDAAATMLQTTAGVIMGTVAYMSPEQARALKVDVRTDCYSLGAVLFEMLSGRQPFKGATGTDVMVAILERDAPLELLRREGLPTQLVWVLAKALEKNPDLRHQNAADLRVDLDRLKRDVATGTVYGDHAAQADRPSAILRDVTDADADAVRMYGLSRATMVAAAIGLVLLLALPFVYRQTFGAEQRAPLPAAAAEIRGRDLAAALGRTVEGREAEASLAKSTLRLDAIRNLGPDEARRVVREGHVAEWDLEFDATATDTTHGRVIMSLTPDGRLRSFTATPAKKRDPLALSNDEALARTTELARTHLGVDVATLSREHAYRSGDGLTFEAQWKNAAQVFGHDEVVRATIDQAGVVVLSRRLQREEAAMSPLTRRLTSLRAGMAVATVTGLFVFGIFVLVRTRRWSLVAARLPVALSAALLLGFLSITVMNETSGEVLVLVAVGVLFAAGALPGIAGVIAWLKQGSPVRLHGAEQIVAGHFRSPAVAASITAGLAGGAALAVVAVTHTAAALHLEGYTPSITRELGVASPIMYVSMLGWLAAACGVALGVAVLYELPVRLVRRPLWLVLLLVVITGFFISSGQPVWAATLMAVLLVGITVGVYAWKGAAAVVVSIWVLFLLLDLLAARSMGGPLAGSRATILLVALMALVALAVWGYAGERMKTGAANLSSKSGIR